MWCIQLQLSVLTVLTAISEEYNKVFILQGINNMNTRYKCQHHTVLYSTTSFRPWLLDGVSICSIIRQCALPACQTHHRSGAGCWLCCCRPGDTDNTFFEHCDAQILFTLWLRAAHDGLALALLCGGVTHCQDLDLTVILLGSQSIDCCGATNTKRLHQNTTAQMLDARWLMLMYGRKLRKKTEQQIRNVVGTFLCTWDNVSSLLNVWMWIFFVFQ